MLKFNLIKGLETNSNGCEIIPFTKDYGHKLFLMITMVLMFLLVDEVLVFLLIIMLLFSFELLWS